MKLLCTQTYILRLRSNSWNCEQVDVFYIGNVDPDQELIDVRMNAIKHKILILSGKGGICIYKIYNKMNFQNMNAIYNIVIKCILSQLKS